MSSQKIISRFAPSPTGIMHFGNFRTALFNYLFALQHNGKFILRIEDTDLERSRAEYLVYLLDDLKNFAINYESISYQSKRSDLYEQYYQQLISGNQAYHCFCSEEKLTKQRKLQLASSQAPRYPGTCSNLNAAEVALKIAAGLTPSLRFKVPIDQVIEFDDVLKGRQSFASNDLGDFIIRRSTGGGSFMFCNAIDDSLMQVSHVLRGEDHLTNTPRQILILQQLGLRIPNYGHFPMIVGSDGTKLSKRNGSLPVRQLLDDGYSILAICNYLARLGHSYSDNSLLSLAQLAEKFSLNNIAKSAARYDLKQLQFWQKEVMLHSSGEQIQQMIKTTLVPEENIKQFLNIMQQNITMPSEALFWEQALFSDNADYSAAAIEIIKDAGKEFFNLAASVIKNNDLAVSDFIAQVKKLTSTKGRKLFAPLRAAITTVLYGPELKNIIELIGWDKVKQRLASAANI